MSADEFNIKKSTLRRWATSLAQLIGDPQHLELPRKLITAMQDLVSFDYSTTYLFRQNTAPVLVYDETPREPVSYAESPYLLDPAYVRFVNGSLPLVCRLTDLMPDDFHKSDYYAQYYKIFDIVEEFCISIPVAKDATLHMSLFRTGNSAGFSASDEQMLLSLTPIISSLIKQWWAAEPDGISVRNPRADQFHEHLEKVLSSFGTSLLTAREKQILHLTMRGFSDKLTARELEITPGTVRNHKKSIFSKLNVSSQGQVFGLFLDVLQRPVQGAVEDDPLAALLDERKGMSPHDS